MKLNKLTKSRIVCAVVSLVLAATLAFYVLPSLYGDQRATRAVIKINREVPAGTEITAAMVSKKEVGSYGLDSSVLTKSGDVVGKVCKRDLTRHDLLYPGDFCKASEYKKLGGINSHLLKDGDVLVSVTTKTPAAAVAGQITSGDVVDVCIAHKSQVTDIMGNSKTSMTATFPPALCNMVVYSVQDSNLNSTAVEKGSDNSVPAVVTLVATPAQAAELARYEYSDVDYIHLVFDVNVSATQGGNSQ